MSVWELVVETLARNCDPAVPQSVARTFASRRLTFLVFLVRRFDRTPADRLQFASAMTITGRLDSGGASTSANHLEIARVLIKGLTGEIIASSQTITGQLPKIADGLKVRAPE